MRGCRAEPGGNEERTDFVAVQADGMGLVVGPGPADMHRRGVSVQVLLLGVAVESGDGAQPAGDRCRRPTLDLELASEGLYVAAANLEQLEVAPVAERDKLAEIQSVRIASEAPIAAEETGEHHMFRIDQSGVLDDDSSRGDGGHGIPPESMGRGGRGDRAPHG